MVLFQVGAFYEAAGLDAVMLVEHCGSHFTGDKWVSAGVRVSPVENIQNVLRQLVRVAGFDVVSACCADTHAQTPANVLVGTQPQQHGEGCICVAGHSATHLVLTPRPFAVEQGAEHASRPVKPALCTAAKCTSGGRGCKVASSAGLC